MTRWAWIVALALGACHRTPTARERALRQLPGEVDLIAAADGAALASPAFRKAIDVIRPRVPPSLGCVIDAALAADAVALAVGPKGISVVAVSPPNLPCPALARIEPDLGIATVGARDVKITALEAPRWQRARTFLISAPIAFAADRGGVHAIAGAQLDPAAAWLTLDAVDPDAVERAARDWLERLHASQLHLARDRDQIRITLAIDGLRDADLGALAEDAVRLVDAARDAAPAPACPAPDQVVTSCALTPRGFAITAASLAVAKQALVGAPGAPVIENGEVIGVRLTADGSPLLQGDVVLAVDGHRVRSRDELARRVSETRSRLVLDVRRDGRTVAIEVAGSE